MQLVCSCKNVIWYIICISIRFPVKSDTLNSSNKNFGKWIHSKKTPFRYIFWLECRETASRYYSTEASGTRTRRWEPSIGLHIIGAAAGLTLVSGGLRQCSSLINDTKRHLMGKLNKSLFWANWPCMNIKYNGYIEKWLIIHLWHRI